MRRGSVWESTREISLPQVILKIEKQVRKHYEEPTKLPATEIVQKTPKTHHVPSRLDIPLPARYRTETRHPFLKSDA